jgi:hypothetical protein
MPPVLKVYLCICILLEKGDIYMSIQKTTFDEIESLVWKHDISLIDAIVLYAEQNNIDVEDLGKLVRSNENLKGMIQLEAEELNYLPKSSNLSSFT